MPFPSSGDLPNPGIKFGSPALRADSLPPEPPGKPIMEIFVLWGYINGIFFDMCDILWFKRDFHHVEEPSRFHG